MNSRQRVLAALNNERPDKIPFAEHDVGDVVLQALFGKEKASDPVYVAEQLGMDVLTFTLVPPLFVAETILPDGRKHQTSGKLHSRKDLALMESMQNPEDPQLYIGLDSLLEKKGDFAVVGKTRLGLSAMLMSMGLEGFSMALADDRELVEIVLKRYVEWSRVAIDEMTKRGADVIWCFDDFAYGSGPMMSPAVFRDLILPHLLELCSGINLPWIFHSDGDLSLVIEDLLTLGMNGLHPIETGCMSLKETRQQTEGKVCLVGNVSVDVLARGSVADVYRDVDRCMNEGGEKGFMISSSNSIPDYARPENVTAMAEKIRELNHIKNCKTRDT